MAEVHKFTIFADYFQIVLMDENCDDDFSEIWTEEALRRMLAVGKSSVCPGTLRNVDVDVEVHFVDQAPELDFREYDHAAEACIELASGKLVVMSCTGYLPDAPRISISPGCYRVIFVVNGVDTIQNEWESAEEIYKIFLWKSTPCEPKLIKHWDNINV